MSASVASSAATPPNRPRRVRRAPAPCSPSSGPSGCSRRWPTTAAPWACPSSRPSPGCPCPTIHRLLRTLVDLGYLRQDSSRQYVLAPRADPARRELRRDAQRLGQAAPRPAGRRARRVGQPRHARRRRDRLRRAGAVAARDADVHRGRPSGPAPLHGRRQGDHGADAAGPGARPAAAHRYARAHRAHHHRSRRLRRPRWSGSASTATPSTTRSRSTACAASPWRCPTPRPSSDSRSAGRPPG